MTHSVPPVQYWRSICQEYTEQEINSITIDNTGSCRTSWFEDKYLNVGLLPPFLPMKIGLLFYVFGLSKTGNPHFPGGRWVTF